MGTNSSSGAGVGGASSSGFGLSGSSRSGRGVHGTSGSSFGVVGITAANATSVATAVPACWAEDLSTNKNKRNSGVAGTSTYGYGGSFTSQNGIGLYATGIFTSNGFNSVGSIGEFDAPPPASEYPSGISAAVTGTSTYSYDGDYFGTDWIGIGCDVERDPSEDRCSVTSTINAQGAATFSSITSNATPVLRSSSSDGKALTP